MRLMRRLGRLFLVIASVFAVVLADAVWPRLRALVGLVTMAPPLVRLRERVARLPVAGALLLFLIPEACSRSGWVISAWLVLHGEPWRALACYAATKLLAVLLALWVCSAGLTVLLRVPVFARVHAGVLRRHKAAADWMSRHGGGRLAGEMARRRAHRRRPGISVRSSAADPAPATPSAPASPSPTG